MYRPLILTLLACGLLSAAAPPLFDATAQHWDAIRGSATVDSKVERKSAPSIRVEPAGMSDAWIRSTPVQLTIGRQYELSGWIRTDSLETQDTNRSPITVGAALQMASMPHDVHSESIGGTHDWTRVSLRFTATRSQDEIVLMAANGGLLHGKAWFEGISLDETSSAAMWPNKKAVKTFGPAYRYPNGGWIYLHIEGEPYERGYQHGYLLSKEIMGYMARGSAQLGNKSTADWNHSRNTANALFLRGFDEEILQEMKGIADGANAAGARWDGRPLDVLDIVTLNTVTEIDLVESALELTPTGLEGLNLRPPNYFDKKRDTGDGPLSITERCSAFAATGKATADGKMVVGHITWWPLTLGEQTNIMLDVKPTKGHRVMMQAYPGGIQSGTDWYQNDAGVVLTETTIRQSPFNVDGTPVAYRARRAIQYGDDVDHVVNELKTKNNGLYTNEWIIGDARTNEIAMLELGTNRTRLYRSSKNDWFAGTEGFYWGCNNAKDLNVRLEYAPDPKARPESIPFVPAPRDVAWQQMFEKWKGRIDETFGFKAFTTPPLTSIGAMDVKIVTSELAKRMMAWTVFGMPNERERVPSEYDKRTYAGNQGLYSSGYRVMSAMPTEALAQAVRENEAERVKNEPVVSRKSHDHSVSYSDRLWKGWILPASDSDLWLTMGGVAYYNALESKHDWSDRLEAYRAQYRLATLDRDIPLRQLHADPASREWAAIASRKGALLLDEMRQQMGDDKFFEFMKDFYAGNTTKTVTTAAFIAEAGKANGKSLNKLFKTWLDGDGLPGASADGPVFLASDIMSRLGTALIVYGTTTDAAANRYAAETLQRIWNNRYESRVPIRKDFEVTGAELASHDVVFVGRPETNSALHAWQGALHLDWDQGVFSAGGKEFASEYDALALAARNPQNAKRMVLVLAGNSALETVRNATSGRLAEAEYQVFDAGKTTQEGFVLSPK
ncbi:MAG TPA: C45 family autoproteolytic acyltransferase/hydrolase [Bryobacteraceae bacterium]|jgi:hypothetical protein